MEKKHGQMGENTKVTTEILKRMALELSFGQMATCIKVIGEETNRMEKEYTST